MTVALLLLLSGCVGNIHGLYEESRLEAFLEPGPPGENWQPDARAQVSGDLVHALVVDAVTSTLAQRSAILLPLPAGQEARLEPRIQLRRLDISEGESCSDCFAVDLRMRGQLHWSLGVAQGDIPFQVQTQGELLFTSEASAQGHRLQARLASLHHLRLRLGDFRLSSDALENELRAWLRRQLLERLGPISLGEIGGADLPVRAVRIRPDGNGIGIEVLSIAPRHRDLPRVAVRDEGWQAQVSTATLLALARRAAFEQGEIGHGVFLDPRGLSLDGQDFEILLRVWRLQGRGWWRDYRIRGRIQVGSKKLKLIPDEVEELAQSRGAGFADPLALMAEGRIVDAIAAGAAQALPLRHGIQLGAQSLQARLEEALGGSGTLLVKGSLQVQENEDALAPESGSSAPSSRPPPRP